MGPDAPGRLENLKELINTIGEYESLAGFLEHVSLVMDNESDSDGPKVSIMTLHAAKGLEFPVVFLTGLEDGLLPHSRSREDSEELAEERRLFYVGITRAKQTLTLTLALSYGGRTEIRDMVRKIAASVSKTATSPSWRSSARRSTASAAEINRAFM